MTGLQIAQAIESTPLAVEIARSSWLFPLLETLHVLAIALVVGSIALLDIRLLGLGGMRRTVAEMMRSVLPWVWSAFVMAAICGALLFSSKATAYYVNLPFRFKFACLILAAANMLAFHYSGDVARWESRPPPVRARTAAAISLVLWISIVAAGRWIGFTT